MFMSRKARVSKAATAPGFDLFFRKCRGIARQCYSRWLEHCRMCGVEPIRVIRKAGNSAGAGICR